MQNSNIFVLAEQYLTELGYFWVESWLVCEMNNSDMSSLQDLNVSEYMILHFNGLICVKLE